MAEHREDRRRQRDDEGDRAEQQQAQDQRAADADPARPGAVLLRQLVGQDRDEDEIVDAEHDLHHDQGDERRPGGGIGGECQQIVHRVFGPPR